MTRGAPTMTTNLRPIAPIALPDDVRRATDFGEKPKMVWVDPCSIYVDDDYQRDLNRRSFALVRRIVEGFAWRKLKPPIVVDVGGKLHCVNGQHTAIAAATLRVPKIPVFVVDAGKVEQRADSFVSHNRDQLPMASLDLYRARVTAGDKDALDVQTVCQLAGVRLRNISPQSKIAPGDCPAIITIARVVKRRGVKKARAILEALVKAGRAPIAAAEIDAVELVLCVDRPELTAFDLAPIVRKVGNTGLAEAIVNGKREHRPVKELLREKYNAGTRKAAA